jgi:hypothetical protein
MAILAIVSAPGITKEIYETLRKEVDWEHKHATGAVFHAAGFGSGKDSGIHVADIWESEKDFNNFIDTRLMPVLQRLNVPRPDAEIFEVYNTNIFATAERYRVAEA